MTKNSESCAACPLYNQCKDGREAVYPEILSLNANYKDATEMQLQVETRILKTFQDTGAQEDDIRTHFSGEERVRRLSELDRTHSLAINSLSRIDVAAQARITQLDKALSRASLRFEIYSMFLRTRDECPGPSVTARRLPWLKPRTICNAYAEPHIKNTVQEMIQTDTTYDANAAKGMNVYDNYQNLIDGHYGP